jgi:HlyD family secretion protein
MRRSPIAILIILLIVLIGLGYFMTNPESGQDVLVGLGLAQAENKGYVVSGMLEAQVTYLAGVNGGRVQELIVSEGQRVEKGEVLARLDTSFIEPLLEAAQARYDAYQAQLDLLLADPREVDLEAAQAALNLALTIKESASQALEDAREFAPEQVRDEQIAMAQAALDQAQAGVDVAHANLDALEQGASKSEISSVAALVDAAEADLNSQKSTLDYQEITAPFGGVILEIFTLPGELSLPGQSIFALADMDMLELSVYIPEADLGWARIGDDVEIIVDAYPERVFSGEVIYIADEAEFTPRNVQTPEERVILVYEIRVRVLNSGGELKPGLPAQVTFGVGS